MKIFLQILLGVVGLFVAFFLLMALIGTAMHLVIICAVLAAIFGVCRWQYTRWESRRLPTKRAVQKVEQKTEKALRELERKVNKS